MKSSVRAILCAVVAFAAASASGAGAALAAPGVPETRALPNGLRIVLLEDHAVPLTAVSLWVGAGSKIEGDDTAGFVHYLEHMIQRGTDTTGAFEYTRRANRWGGGMVVRSNYDRTCITMTGVPQALGDMIDGAASMALKAGIKDSEVDLEIGPLTQEVRAYYDLPSSVAFLETMRAAFDSHPYRWPTLGNYRTLGTIKAEPLQAFYRRLYVPNNMVLAVAGDFDPRAIQARIEAAFGAATRGTSLPADPPTPAARAGHIDVEKRLDLGGPWTTLSFVGPGYRHPDRAAFEVLTTALAEPASGLAAALHADASGAVAQVSYYGLEDAGVLYIALNPATAALSYGAAASATRAIVAFKTGGLGAASLPDRIARMVRDERARATSIQERAERLGEATLFGGPRYYWDRVAALRAVTPADLTRVAGRYLVAENLRLVVLVPKSTGDLQDTSKEAFHKALDSLGKAGTEPDPGLSAALYSADDAQRLDPAAWGNAKAAATARAAKVTTLKNGMTVVVVEDRRWPIAAASLHLRGGSEMDPPGREGTAAIALRAIAARTAAALRPAGTPARPPAVFPEAQAMRDAIEVRLSGDAADLGAGLGALAAAVREPLPGADIEPARRAALGAIDRAESDPDVVSLDLFREKVFAGHPYAHRPDGTPSGLKAITADDVAAYGARVLRPAGAVLAIVGDFDGGDLVRDVEERFRDWKGAADKGSGRDPAAPAAAAKGGAAATPANTGAIAGEFTRQMSVPQTRVVAGVPGVAAGDADFGALRALGAGVTLLAFDDLVFRQRSAFSAVSIPEALRDGGGLAFALTTPPPRGAEVLFDLQRLLRRVAAQPFSADDVRDIGRVLAGREAMIDQSAPALASGLAWRVVSGTGADSWRQDLAGTVPDAARLQALAESRLRPEKLITIVVGPPAP